ncbi:MAG TPA: 4'-phosphopantetheinyl transferase superfamily protein [Cellvibrio sp.]|nr:4'-phosphopantetheinyl transferase superfamily protein [Cellvibrio sp.]
MPLLPEFSPTVPSLHYGQVHLWFLDVNQFGERHQQQAHHLMNADEHERARKFMRGKEEYIASRWLQRKVLGRYLDQAPELVTISRAAKGKPFISNSDLRFNLSHSGNWVVLALAREVELGVDIEQIKKGRDLLSIAESYYHPDEFAQLQQFTDPAAKIDFFYQLWTLKEALLKALGVGISAGLEKAHFRIEHNAVTANIAPELDTGNTWQFGQWRLSDNFHCALATSGTEVLQTHWLDAIALLD